MTANVTWQNISQADFYLPIPKPTYIGPSWARNPEWDGTDPLSEFKLPQWTLGWQIAKWISKNLRNDEGEAFRLTWEQLRLLLWWYAVDEAGRFVYRQGVLQRIKGW